MKSINDQSASAGMTVGSRQRSWLRPTIGGLLLLIIGVVLIALLGNGFSLTAIVASEQQVDALEEQSAAVALQPQGTPPVGMRGQGAGAGSGSMYPNALITATMGISGSLPARMAPPIMTDITTTTAISTPAVAPTATPAPQPLGIVAVAGGEGAAIHALDGVDLLQIVTIGSRLLIIGRSDDSAWLLAQTDDGLGWVRSIDVIVFNTGRLNVAGASPPADDTIAGSDSTDASASQREASAPTMATVTTTAGLTDTAAVAPSTELQQMAAIDAEIADTADTPDDAGTVTASLDASKAKGLNIRSGPSTDYGRAGAIDVTDALIVTGRNRAGDWLFVETAEGMLNGWAATYYLSVTGDVEQLPEVQTSAVSMTEAPLAVAATTQRIDELPVSVGSVTAASVRSTVSTGLEGTLAFQTGQGGTIYAYALETDKLWPLTTGFDPAISPDGATVAFARIGDNGGLYLIDIDGGNERQIYAGPRVIASPKWSEDGAQIAFNYSTSSRECRDMGSGNCVSDEQFASRRYQSLDPNDYPLITVYTYDIGVIDVDGGNFHSLSPLDSARALDWGTAGIVYQSSDGIQVISAQGGESAVVLFDPLKQVDQDPAWVGGSVVFQRPGASHWQIWRADANGANITALTQPQTVLVNQLPSSVSPASSPDGSKIAFVSNRTDSGEAGDWRIWVMDADGSSQRPLSIDVPIHYTFGAEQMVSWGG